MSYLLLDDDFAENRKVSSLKPAAFKVHVTALCYCARHLTDGLLTPQALKVIQAVADVPAFQKRADELVAAGLWKRHDNRDCEIHDYLEHNLSAAQVKAKKAAAKKAADTRWGNAPGTATGNAERIASGTANSNALPSPALDFRSSNTSPALDNARTNGHANTNYDEPAFALLHLAVGPTDENLQKLKRAANGLPLAAIVHAREAAQGPSVHDPLAVALAELKKARAPAA